MRETASVLALISCRDASLVTRFLCKFVQRRHAGLCCNVGVATVTVGMTITLCGCAGVCVQVAASTSTSATRQVC